MARRLKTPQRKRMRDKVLPFLIFTNKIKYGKLTCEYCGKQDLRSDTPSAKNSISIDHIVPLSKGGSKMGISNLAIACYDCNSRKTDMSVTDFKELLVRNKK